MFIKQSTGGRQLNNANQISVVSSDMEMEFVLNKENLEARINRVGAKTRLQHHLTSTWVAINIIYLD